jgi:hypothetical protein
LIYESNKKAFTDPTSSDLAFSKAKPEHGLLYHYKIKNPNKNVGIS